MSEECISDNEQLLADKLKNLCTYEGKEQHSTLKHSATVLLQLGNVHLDKARVYSEQPSMHQKLAFVRSCALLNAARIRFEMIRGSEKEAEVNSALRQLSEALYKACKISARNRKSLPDYSSDFYEKICTMRQEMNASLDSIPTGEQGTSRTVQLERQIISKIQSLCMQATENYIRLMKEITCVCIELLGKPPCKFCQVGLGSMARKEITLYSDFEHIIILQDEIEELSTENREKILEYFRWFAVYFQVIIIGFGETFVRSVGVKSINDLYSSDPSKNWYYDVFTPCGISFDGMVPHSCMNPLGRQYHTKDKKHKVEFIQPASRMASYLSSEQHLKNGYYIKDILARTCKVYGDAEVYECFTKASEKITNEETTLSVADEKTGKVSRNVNEYIRGGRMRLDRDDFNPKVTFYRPITALLAYIASYFKVPAASSFDIVDELEKLHVIDDKLSQNLKYAVATVCKIRMLAYSTTGHQRFKTGNLIFDIMGTIDSQLCYRVIRYLVIANSLIMEKVAMTNMRKHPKESDCIQALQYFNKKFWSESVTEDVFELLEQGKYKEAAILGEEHMQSLKLGDEMRKLYWILVQCYFRLGEHETKLRHRYWLKARTLCETVVAFEEIPIGAKLDCFYIGGLAYHFAEDHKNALKMYQNWLHLYHTTDHTIELLLEKRYGALAAVHDEIALEEHKNMYPTVLQKVIELWLGCFDPKETIYYFYSLLPREDTIVGRVSLSYGIACCQMSMGYNTLAKGSFFRLIEEFETTAPSFKKLLIPILEEICQVFEAYTWVEKVPEIIRLLYRFSSPVLYDSVDFFAIAACKGRVDHQIYASILWKIIHSKSKRRSRSAIEKMHNYLHLTTFTGKKEIEQWRINPSLRAASDLAVTIILVDEEQVLDTAKQCIEICKTRQGQPEFVGIFAHTLSVTFSRLGQSMEVFTEVLELLQEAHTPVLVHKFFEPILVNHFEKYFKVNLRELEKLNEAASQSLNSLFELACDIDDQDVRNRGQGSPCINSIDKNESD